MSEIKSKILVPHAPECRIDKNDIYEWSAIPIGREWLAADGTRKGSNHVWLVFECNDTVCPGRIIVRAQDILLHLKDA